MHVAFVSLGSNMGDSRVLLEKACDALGSLPGGGVAARSSVYCTEPQGLAGQPFFLNQVVRLHCSEDMTPVLLLEQMLAVEKRLGRKREPGARFGPRCIDLDLLLFGDQRMDTERLTLPHPRMLGRAFVLVPLHEIAPDLLLPQGMSVSEALGKIRFTQMGNTLFQNDATDALGAVSQ